MTDILMKTEIGNTETGTSCEVGGEISVMHLQVMDAQVWQKATTKS